MKKIIQVIPTILYGDGCGNYALALHHALRDAGYETKIFADRIDRRIEDGIAESVESIPLLAEDDILIYHFASFWEKLYALKNLPCKKVFIYHNVTPPEFLKNFDSDAEINCRKALFQLRDLRKIPDYCLAVSDFNKKDLLEAGYECPVDVLPAPVSLSDYDEIPDKKIIDEYKNDGITNILFTGRVVPNKKHEDIIAAFYMYQKYYNPKSRLIFVGSKNGKYGKCLEKYIKALKLKNVIFTGHIKFTQILSYYKIADLFLCQSEHEGFCIPLVEAMCFDLPVVAYDSSAIGDTLGRGGFLMKEKDPLKTAGVMNYILTHEDIRSEIREGQKDVLERFDNKKIKTQFLAYINDFIKNNK